MRRASGAICNMGSRVAASRVMAKSTLEDYRRKRDFTRTPEPAGSGDGRPGWSFVVQKHDATSLHYDFRLELDGVLKSWAVPKGPSVDPKVKRLAMEVEDHPIEYGDFEGVIPEDEYGGGTVLLWDQGTWRPREKDPARSYARGRLAFDLEGEKLRGAWVIVKATGRFADRRRRKWLLMKLPDEAARPGTGAALLEERPESVGSGKGIEEIAAKPERVWRSTARPRRSAAPVSRAKRTKGGPTAEVAGVRITHPERVLWPDEGITKLQLARFYESIADWIVPHLAGRPLTLVRCPEGLSGDCVYQKHRGYWAPDSLRRVKIQEKRKVGEYLVADDLPGLIGLVQLDILEVHTWNSRVETLEAPDRVVVDLDPGEGVDWSSMIDTAREVRERFAAVGLESWVKTTGGKGLHVVAPFRPRAGWDECLVFAHALAESLARDRPELLTTDMAKAKRRGKIFLDILRNVRGSTSVAAYSTRARPGAPLSAPLAWDELGTEMGPSTVTLRGFAGRLDALGGDDPWKGYLRPRKGFDPVKACRALARRYHPKPR